jgi:hypothetical protein
MPNSDWYRKPLPSDFPNTSEGKKQYAQALNTFWEKQNQRAARYGFGSRRLPRAKKAPKSRHDRSGPGKGRG